MNSQVGGAGAGDATELVNKTAAEVKKRLMREAAELATSENEFSAHPIQANLFEWHFTIKGLEGSELEHGIYHGRILFPTEYPMKPPSFILLTPNGRFHAICISISINHPETWSIRTALNALRSFLLTRGNEEAIGPINFPPQERKKPAINSRTCHECGSIIKLEGGKEDATVNENTSDAATVAAPKRQMEVAPRQNDCNPVTTPSTAVLSADNQDATSARNVETNKFTLEQQEQHNEHIKHILGDFVIGCFIILIFALSFGRLLTIFTQCLFLKNAETSFGPAGTKFDEETAYARMDKAMNGSINN